MIPAYRAAAFIRGAVESVLRQTYRDHEILVVNDGSPDTPELEGQLRPFRERITYLRKEHGGPAAARNGGIRHARGEYVGFLDADDQWLPEFLASQVERLDREPTLDLIYADALLFGETSREAGTLMDRCPSTGEVTFESLVETTCVVFTSTVVARREALLQVGLFDEGFTHAEDYDLWLRLAHAGGRLAYQRRVLARHREHGASLAAREGALLAGELAVLRKTRATLPLSTERAALVDGRIRACEGRRAVEEGKRLLVERRFGQARNAFRRAGVELGSDKLRLVSLGLRIAPGLVRRVYLRRLVPAPPDSGLEAAPETGEDRTC